MRQIEKMYTLSISNPIDFCIQENFKHNSISHLKYINKIILKEHEILLEIKNNKILILDSHSKQDNLRLQFIIQFIQYILDNELKNISCKIILNTGDGCSNTEKYTRLCFSCEQISNHIPIPDPHIFQYFNFQDDIAFENKKDQALFVGSDTGAIGDDLINERIRLCNLVKQSSFIYAKISNFVHYNELMLKDLGINIQDISCAYMPISDQLKYKYILNISGNTASWDRIPWGMQSNSYLINIKSSCTEQNWYYPLIEKEEAIDTVSLSELNDTKITLNTNKKNKQKYIASIILNKNNHVEYFKKLILFYEKLYNS
jgi:hypothetical protein